MKLCRPDTAGLTKRNFLRIKPSWHRDWLTASVCLPKLDNSDFLNSARLHAFASKIVPGMMLTVANIPATWRLTPGPAPRAGCQVDAFIAPGLFLILVLMTA